MFLPMKKGIYRMLGASNHTEEEREKDDYYATDPLAIDPLIMNEQFQKNIWEPACGEGHLSKRLEAFGYRVRSTELIDRGYGQAGIDFLKCTEPWPGDLVTNPPYKLAQQFVEQGLSLIHDGAKATYFLRLNFLEGVQRRSFFRESPPKTVYVFSRRVMTAKNGDFSRVRKGGSAVAFAWFVWVKGFRGKTTVEWI